MNEWKKRIISMMLTIIMCLLIGVNTFAEETSIVSMNQTAFQNDLKAVANLKAVSAGRSRVQLSWNKVDGAEEYIIYRQIGKSSFQYLYITKNLTYLDMSASGIEYNFYRVYPCYTSSEGKRVLGPSTMYVYAKARLSAVTGVRATTAGVNKVKLTWNKVVGADGYLIYRQVGKGTYGYRGMTSNLSYVDTTASSSEYNFYWIFPYYEESGKILPGSITSYVYAKGGVKDSEIVQAEIQTVYVTPSGKNYHRMDCSTLKRSKTVTAMSRKEAELSGRTSCKVCKP